MDTPRKPPIYLSPPYILRWKFSFRIFRQSLHPIEGPPLRLCGTFLFIQALFNDPFFLAPHYKPPAPADLWTPGFSDPFFFVTPLRFRPSQPPNFFFSTFSPSSPSFLLDPSYSLILLGPIGSTRCLPLHICLHISSGFGSGYLTVPNSFLFDM